MITNILVATDGSETALHGVQYAAYLASKLGCKITLLHVVELQAIPLSIALSDDASRNKFKEEVQEAGRSIIRLSQKPLAEAGIAASYEVLEGRPADVICQYVNDGNFDLVIVGNRGRSKVSRMIMGSVSENVVRSAACPVLVVK